MGMGWQRNSILGVWYALKLRGGEMAKAWKEKGRTAQNKQRTT